MTDVQNHVTTDEVDSGASMEDPPPYTLEPSYMPPSDLPPPYTFTPIVYPQYLLPGATSNTDTIPLPVPPPYPSMQGGCDANNLLLVENVLLQDTESRFTAEQTDLIASSFDDKTVRRAFIRKVFSVVTLQLLVTFSVVCVFTFSETVKKAVQENIMLYFSSYIIFLIVAVCMFCCKPLSRSHPCNLISLSVVTLSLSYMVGTVASFHNTSSVVIAMGAALVISFSIIILSAQSRVKFNVCNGILIVLAVDLLMFAFFCIFYYNHVVQIVFGCLGALVYSVFLAVDCQLVMTREKYGLSPEEYVFAALIIYLDIIMVFLYILSRFGRK